MAQDGTSRERACAHCGHPLPDTGQFCVQCGAPMTRAEAPAPGAARVPTPSAVPGATGRAAESLSKKTMIGFSPLAPPPGAAPAAPGPAPNVTPAMQKTMLGMPPAAAKPPAPTAPGPSPAFPKHMTLLGVATPGIAPLRPGEVSEPGSIAVPVATKRYPSPAPAAPAATLLEPPALADLPPPSSAHVGRRSGVPVAAVALTAGALLLGGGIAIAWLWRAAPAMTAQARVSPEGDDVLHLHCDPRSCKNGTTVQLESSRATFVDGEIDLALGRPLQIGDNALSLRIDRPGWGRDEIVRLVVPVAFRIRADVSPMNAPTPSIVIRVETLPGSDVTLDGRPVTLDSAGVGSYAIDETSATEGPADESHVVAVDVPYVVVPKGAAAEKGSVSARVVVAPLRVDAPGGHAVVDRDRVLVAGRAAKGATVTLDAEPVAVGPEGAFETTIALPALGERIFQVRGSTGALTPRTVRIGVKRVRSLAAEARAFERQKIVGYDAAMGNLAGSVGQPMVVEGELVESRASGHHTLLLVDDRRGCAKGPCKVRVVVQHDVTFPRGAIVRACGRVARPFATPTGEVVLEVDADFVLQTK